MSETSNSSEKQKELVDKIYSVHEKLRKRFREVTQAGGTGGGGMSSCVGNWEVVWENHKKNLEELKDYSKAMHELATEVWDPRNLTTTGTHLDTAQQPKCRIEWVYLKCHEYFQNELLGSTKLKLLDVGSCYNPFSRYMELFDVTAVDLCPAPGCEDSVYQCDFLQVDLGEELKHHPGGEFRELESLPKGSFDLVVFSFFLEYLPDPRQRLEASRKAAELLTVGGILFVMQPDSSSVTVTSAGRMKKVKVGMAKLGLKRLCLEKLTHMWCSAYKKLGPEEHDEFLRSSRFLHDVSKVKYESDHELFEIPQDSKFIDIEGDSMRKKERLEPFDVELAGELPFF